MNTSLSNQPGALPANTMCASRPSSDDPASICIPEVLELVAIGAAVASHCEPCLKHHVREAEKLGVSRADIRRAVAMAARVKEAPHRNILKLAEKLTQLPPEPGPAIDPSCCSGR